jgi:ribonuclease-3
VYTVAVYFRGRRLASAMGHSIQQAEMNAAKKALEISQGTNTRAIQSGGRVFF